MRIALHAVAALGYAALNPPAVAQPAQVAAGLSPANCSYLDEIVGHYLPSVISMAKNHEGLISAMEQVRPLMQNRPRVLEAHDTLLSAQRDFIRGLDRYRAAIEDYQARLRECRRESR